MTIQNTAMVVRAEAVEVLPFHPANLDQTFSLAEQLSKASLLPAAFRGKPADCFAVLLLGHDLHVSPMQALLNIDVIEGKPRVNALLTVALVLRSPLCRYFVLVESTPQIATYETFRERNPTPTRLSYTLEQAQRAGLTGKGNWKSDAEGMLRRRASMRLAREVFPDVVGNVYDADEIEEIRERVADEQLTAPPPPPVQAPKAAPSRAKVEPKAAKAASPPARPGDEFFGSTPMVDVPPGQSAVVDQIRAEQAAQPPAPVREREPGEDDDEPAVAVSEVDAIIGRLGMATTKAHYQAEHGPVSRLTGADRERGKAAYHAAKVRIDGMAAQ